MRLTGFSIRAEGLCRWRAARSLRSAVFAVVLASIGIPTVVGAPNFAVAAPAPAGTAPATADIKAGADIKTGAQVLEGEIIDLDCYLLDPVDGRGAEHNECARHCLADGKPSAFLVGDRLYMIIGAGQAVSHEEMGALAGYPVRLSGSVITQNGIAFVFLEGVERTGTTGNEEGAAKE